MTAPTSPASTSPIAITSRLDHLVIAATTLESGLDWFEQQSAVRLADGGKHPGMGTHNRLTKLSDRSYLEVIAIDPQAQAPDRPRWFGLDEPSTQTALATAPRLLTWVLATNDLDAALAAVSAEGVNPGHAIRLHRGSLSWRIAVRDDGHLPAMGCFPTLLQWDDGMEPLGSMQDQGLCLDSITVSYPDADGLGRALAAIGASGIVTLEAGEPDVSASISGPKGYTIAL